MIRMPFRSTVLVYEFFTGGGCPAGNLPRGLAAEALGMLWALLTDFRHWGRVRTVTVLDPRFEELVPGLNRKTLPADEVVEGCHDGYHELYLSLVKRCNAVILIAPETEGILARFTAQAESAGIPVLGSSASAVAAAGNKAECHRLFCGARLPSPKTCAVGFDQAPQGARGIGYPLVVKPVDGVGCEGVYRVDKPCELVSILESVRRVTSRDEILLQSFAGGVPASVSLLISRERSLPLSLNRQLIGGGSPFKYSGSEVPFEHKAGQRAVDLARSAVGLIPELRGYVGVDLVLTEDSAQVIEINPRLTTSYVGLRQIAQVNLAGAIWDACMNGIFPERISLAGRIMIRKDDSGTWNLGVALQP
jgi:tyramine---L-glutamate ligase